MKTKKLIIPIVILVGLIVYLFVSSEESSKNDKPFSEFSFEDTASIDKIIISNTLGSSISIQRRNENGTWKINNTETRANKEGITRILSTFHQWKVIQNIDEKDLNSTNKQLAIKHHKIEVFTNGSDKSTRTYYVGDANQSMTGNLGLLKIGDKKSNMPYYIQVPGFYGTIETRFFTSHKDWRSSEVISLRSNDIKSIDLQTHQIPEESYRFEQNLNQFTIFDNENKSVDKFDTLAVRRHLVVFKTLHLESYADFLPQTEIDSIIQSQPLYTLNVTDTNNSSTKVDVYCKTNPRTEEMPKEVNPPCDPQRLYALVNDKDFVVIQVFGWGAIFKPLSFFTTE